MQSSWAGLNVSDNASYQQGTLCDPLAEKMISFGGTDALPLHTGPDSRDLDYMFEERNSWCLPLHPGVYGAPRWGPADKGWKVLDLGFQDMHGVWAHGHRWWFAADGNFVQEDFRELWISENLQVDVLYIEQSQTRGKRMRAELKNVRRKFRIPEGSTAHVVTLPKEKEADTCGSSPH